jgi:hypothetical protein
MLRLHVLFFFQPFIPLDAAVTESDVLTCFFARSVKSLFPEVAFSEEEFRKRIVKWMMHGVIPFSAVELPEFRAMLSLLKSGVAVPSRHTVSRDTMVCYREEEGRVNERLRNAASKISITLDCWTSPNNKAFLGVTGHYIDKDWALKSLLVDFVPLSGEHTGENLCGALVDVCERRGILGKLQGVTTDNAANIGRLLTCFEGACSERGVMFAKDQQRVRCVAHVVNLAAQAFLCELRAEGPAADSNPNCGVAMQTRSELCIFKLRCVVRWIRSSPQRSHSFMVLCKDCHVSEKEAILDSRTRWNSTYEMIKRALELREPLSQTMNAMDYLPELSHEEWVLLKVASQVLIIFEKATRWLCASNYPTLNRAVRVYNYLLDELEYFLGRCNKEEKGRQRAAIIDQCSPTNKRVLTTAMEAAHAKLREYYADTWAGMYAVSLILDPSSKMAYYQANKWEKNAVAYAKDALLQTIEAYGTPSVAAVTVPQSNQASSGADLSDLDEEWDQVIKRRRVEKEGELERYLAAPTVGTRADILGWWKEFAREYPCLARIARDYLAIPATSAPAERVFSGGADLITKKRGSLSEDTIRACMCLNSWL